MCKKYLSFKVVLMLLLGTIMIASFGGILFIVTTRLVYSLMSALVGKHFRKLFSNSPYTALLR